MTLNTEYDCKNALTVADMLNDKVVPFLEEQQIPFTGSANRSKYRILW